MTVTWEMVSAIGVTAGIVATAAAAYVKWTVNAAVKDLKQEFKNGYDHLEGRLRLLERQLRRSNRRHDLPDDGEDTA